jgi:uncharacterized protein
MRSLVSLWSSFMGLPLIWLMVASASTESAVPRVLTAPPEVKPAMWTLADDDTTIYLFGTIHVLPKDFAWRTPRFDMALAQSDTLVLEVADLEDSKASANEFLKLAISPNLPAITERVPENRRARLKLMIDKAGTSAASLRQFESWAVALSLASSAVSDLNVSPEYGVERTLSRAFRDVKKPILGLETSAEQLGFFDALPESAQRVFLVSLIDEQADVQTAFNDMITAWSAGDEKKIAITFDDELALSPELVETLLRGRNRSWAKWLEKRLEQPGTTMVAVGAGHLAGADSVQAMLAAKGLKVARVQ